MKYLNLGCGKRFFDEWTNVDFYSKSPGVIAHNLITGIPFPADSYNVVYHSHVLEHFSKPDAVNFMNECYRVLKAGGIIRVIVPDLEQIVREYLLNLEKAKEGDEQATDNYEWLMLELYDQAVRDISGGEMAVYWKQKNISNEQYITSRVGYEFADFREKYSQQIASSQSSASSSWKRYFKSATYRRLLIHYLVGDRQANHYLNIGRFKSSGEIHKWMYDEYSLGNLLRKAGFTNIHRKSAHQSSIPNWEKYMALDVEDGRVRKPDSLFLEATK